MTNTRAYSLLLAALLFTGCAAKTQTTLNPPPPDANPEPQLATDVRERVKELVALADQYAAGANKLPGRNAQEDRAQTTQQFALLAQILPMLNGPDMSGDFRQQLRIIESTRSQLASGSQDLSVEPTIDTGLRAAHRALAAINQRAFTENAEIAKHLDAMHAKVQELDGVNDATHRLVAAQAFKGSAQAISQMVNALNGRLSEAQPK
ncbi:MAG: hypothetical protein JWN40_855 [Phycisphaerales bacterium]|nr:hypothetical protein [Phycisphaerales bacterium]